jgi:hypothetical protein
MIPGRLAKPDEPITGISVDNEILEALNVERKAGRRVDG